MCGSEGLRPGARWKDLPRHVKTLARELGVLRYCEMRLLLAPHLSFGPEEFKDLLNRPGCPTSFGGAATAATKQAVKAAVKAALKYTGAEHQLDIGIEAQPKGSVYGDVKLLCHLTERYIDCSYIDENTGCAPNIHASKAALGPDNKLCIRGKTIQQDAVVVGNSATKIVLLEKKGNLREAVREIWKEEDERLKGVVAVATNGVINTATVKVVQMMQHLICKRDEKEAKERPVYVAVDQNAEGLLTAARLMEGGVAIEIILGLPENIAKYGDDSVIGNLPKPDEKQRKKLRKIAARLHLDENALDNAAFVNVEQLLSWKYPTLTGIILDAIEDSEECRDKDV